MRVFLDTNVIVSAVATRGLCADVLRDVLIRHRLVVSDALLDEVKAVLQIKIEIPAEEVTEVISLLRDASDKAKPVPLIEIPVADHSDRALASAALAGNADLFVTGDAELLALGMIGRLDIISPRAFWERSRTGLP